MGNINSVLFVCTGNSCRSIMAEALLKKYLPEAGKESIKVYSAGTGTFEGMTPSPETLEVLKAEGIKPDGFKSKILDKKMIREAGLILVMEKMHKNEVLRMVPEAAEKTYLLKEYGPAGAEDDEEGIFVPDPIGRPIEFYKYVLNMIKKEIERIVKIL